jgi:fluoroacetyl-CoA thioesterase
MSLRPGLTASASFGVADADTAIALGSGLVPVLATPRLLAWCEAVTVQAIETGLDEGRTSVGSRVQLDHLRATLVGGRLTVHAQLVHADGRLLKFEVTALDESETVVAHGQITRVVVDRERFLARLGSGGESPH